MDNEIQHAGAERRALNNDLAGFRSAGRYVAALSFRLWSGDARSDELKQRVEAELASGGRGWRLLKLEWQYDLAILIDNLRAWMSRLDQEFNKAA
ncbi:hypothetical protein [Sinorhizobium mexicanum]|uniref:Uncharacterized protein n=1 Tax=Sinorhizobium mexicanum TaxID=375549 RepID=A0A859QFW8_9HYPH|nr:hypothetical protein [Sinorhizobium mexicanum]MBP1884442.1 hypothetical protein [Sinorhizobium mexicanum]QLL65373.1 hypothetical protein FKV68_28935 [Sinorhizobium mexicanum]